MPREKNRDILLSCYGMLHLGSDSNLWPQPCRSKQAEDVLDWKSAMLLTVVNFNSLYSQMTRIPPKETFIWFEMGWSALYRLSVPSTTYKRNLQWWIWRRWLWLAFPSPSEIWICRKVGNEKLAEPHVPHGTAQATALPQLLWKTLEYDLLKWSNQFHSSSVELNNGGNSNWGGKKHRRIE